jgi:hypothetical protein
MDHCKIGLTPRRKGAKNKFLLSAFAPLREISAFAFSGEKSCRENKKLRDINEASIRASEGLEKERRRALTMPPRREFLNRRRHVFRSSPEESPACRNVW